MITPAEIQKKALRYYSPFLTAVLKRANFFPLDIKGNKGKPNLPMEELFAGLKRLLEGAKSKKGYGYTVTLKPIQTRHAGEISMPDEIFFENVEDYVKFIDKEKEFLAFRKIAMQTQKQLPQLMPWMGENPLKIVKYMGDWEVILKIGQYFLDNPQPYMYARAIPLAIPTTFIEKNTSILTEILDAILPKVAINATKNQFEKRFGLLYHEPMIRIRVLDDEVTMDWLGKDSSLPLSTWNKVVIKAKIIFICTDLLNFLRFPPHTDSLIIFGSASTLKVIGELAWLAEKTIYLWTDINVEGFQLLSDLRQHFPKIQSFLLDKITFDKFQPQHSSISKEKVSIIPSLTREEQDFLLFLNNLEIANTLLQEHISQDFLKRKLQKL